MPPNFAFPSPDVDAWVRLSLSAANRANREGRWLQVVGRLDAVYDSGVCRLRSTPRLSIVPRSPTANAGLCRLKLLLRHRQFVISDDFRFDSVLEFERGIHGYIGILWRNVFAEEILDGYSRGFNSVYADRKDVHCTYSAGSCGISFQEDLVSTAKDGEQWIGQILCGADLVEINRC